MLGVTAAGDSLPEAIRRVYQAVDKIRFEGCHYRRDIGKKGLLSKSTEVPSTGTRSVNLAENKS